MLFQMLLFEEALSGEHNTGNTQLFSSRADANASGLAEHSSQAQRCLEAVNCTAKLFLLLTIMDSVSEIVACKSWGTLCLTLPCLCRTSWME
mmetsp:Transcript_99612/g.167993  ORF Transcript_99612/g.167993 Transcript_99612/m.167993 type:complete len:92 (+) Transcript_99612:557-832(+)